jgi:hypothetical protein
MNKSNILSGSSFVPSLLVDTPLPTSAHPLLSTPVPAMRHEQHKKTKLKNLQKFNHQLSTIKLPKRS